MTTSQNQEPKTCKNLVERRRGTSAKTGAGDRAGAYSDLCGKPVEEGHEYCKRCETNIAKRRERDHGKYHARLISQAIKAGNGPRTAEERAAYFQTHCFACQRNSR